jgi:DNA ligase 1
MNREFLMLAHTYKPGKYDVAGWYISEKLDGTRCFWDGGVSRGLPTETVPWAGIIDPKTGRQKGKIKPIATGLWSRYGNPIIAPDWFLNQLPPLMLDGELWAGRGSFQLCRSICSGDTPDPRWNKIEFAVFSTPHPDNFAFEGIIKNANMHCAMNADRIMRWIHSRNKALGNGFMRVQDGATFDEELVCLRNTFEEGVAYLHPQRKLPDRNPEEAINRILDKIVSDGGEGVVIRDANSQWEPRRVRSMLKYKPFHDAEATIVGFTSGRETNKGSRLQGKIGALIVDYKGKRLELSGLTDQEREFADKDQFYATVHPGEDMPTGTQSMHFKVGQTITFKYRELSDEGIPKEARYFRPRDVE